MNHAELVGGLQRLRDRQRQPHDPGGRKRPVDREGFLQRAAFNQLGREEMGAFGSRAGIDRGDDGRVFKLPHQLEFLAQAGAEARSRRDPRLEDFDGRRAARRQVDGAKDLARRVRVKSRFQSKSTVDLAASQGAAPALIIISAGKL